MPVISDSNFCIDRRHLDFKIMDKNDYISEISHYGNEIHPQSDQKYIFICIAKCASSSITHALNQKAYPEPNFHHMGIKEVEELMPFIDTSQYFKFAFVRNPWDRLISLYKDFNNQRMHPEFLQVSGLVKITDGTIYHDHTDFEDFCFKFANSEWWRNEAHHKPQYDYLYINDELKVDCVGRYENVVEDWGKICEKINLNIPIGHRRNSGAKEDYRNWYTEKSRDCIAEVYKKDIEAFGYEF